MRRTTQCSGILLTVAAFGAMLAMPTDGRATFPGRNGTLAVTVARWSPDCQEGCARDYAVGLAAPQGGRLHGFREGRHPAFSPGGQRLALVARGDGFQMGVAVTPRRCRFDVTASIPRRCTRMHSVAPKAVSPAWSPTADRIVFERPFPSRLYVATGRDFRHRRFLAEGQLPDWSSRGAIAFTDGTPDGGISVIGPRGAAARALTEAGYDPSWSPRGDRVAFYMDQRAASGAGLYVVRSDGTGLRRIWTDPSPDQFGTFDLPYSPTWSPDGRTIAFVAGQGDPDNVVTGAFSTGAVYAVGTRGGARRRLIRAPQVEESDFEYDILDLAWQALPRRTKSRRAQDTSSAVRTTSVEQRPA